MNLLALLCVLAAGSPRASLARRTSLGRVKKGVDPQHSPWYKNSRISLQNKLADRLRSGKWGAVENEKEALLQLHDGNRIDQKKLYLNDLNVKELDMTLSRKGYGPSGSENTWRRFRGDQHYKINRLKTEIPDMRRTGERARMMLGEQNETMENIQDYLDSAIDSLGPSIAQNDVDYDALVTHYTANINELLELFNAQYDTLDTKSTDEDARVGSVLSYLQAQYASMESKIPREAELVHNQGVVMSEALAFVGRKMRGVVEDKKRELGWFLDDTKEVLSDKVAAQARLVDFGYDTNKQAATRLMNQAVDAAPHSQVNDLNRRNQGLQLKIDKMKQKLRTMVADTKTAAAKEFTTLEREASKITSKQQRKVDKNLKRMSYQLTREAKEKVKQMMRERGSAQKKAKQLERAGKTLMQGLEKRTTQSAKTFGDSMDDALARVDDSERASRDGISDGMDMLTTLEQGVKDTGKSITHYGRKIKKERAAEIEALGKELEKDMKASTDEVHGAEKHQMSEQELMQAGLATNLAALTDAQDLGLGGLKDMLGEFGAELDQTFDSSDAWQAGFEHDLAGLGHEFEEYQEDTDADLGLLHKETSKSGTMAEESVADYGEDTLQQLQSLDSDF